MKACVNNAISVIVDEGTYTVRYEDKDLFTWHMQAGGEQWEELEWLFRKGVEIGEKYARRKTNRS